MLSGSVGRLGGGLFSSLSGGRRYLNIYHKDIKLDFKILKDFPIGPHKKLPPGVKLNGRIGPWDNYKYLIHYPENYTIGKLDLRKLGGRDPLTGRKIIEGFGGGSKRKARWIITRRFPSDWPDRDGEFVEKVISLNYNPLGESVIALTVYGKSMRWIYATENMKVGDILKSSLKIPEFEEKAIPGNGYVVGALPVGTQICNYEMIPGGEGDGKIYDILGERYSTIIRKYDDKVVIRNFRDLEFAIDQNCQCVAGVMSIHPLRKMHIGSPNRMRWLGNRPRSGLWKRKTGIHGKKIKALPPCEVVKPRPDPPKTLVLHAPTEGVRGMAQGRKRPWNIDEW